MKKVSFLLCFILVTCMFPVHSTAYISETGVIRNTVSTVNLNTNLFHTEKIKTILNAINESLLRQFLEPITMYGPRYTGTYGCEKTASFIFNQFTAAGLHTRYQHWTSFGNRYNPQWFISYNVEGTLPGVQTDDIIIFGAHYDTVKIAPGANDDGSGVAAVLAAASVLSKYTFNRTLKFVTFSGEEVGLLGSWAYAREAYMNDDNILFDFNADMIGHATTKNGGSRMVITTTEDATWIQEVFNQINELSSLQFELRQGTINRDGRGWSDYYPFAAFGFEAVACWEGEHDPNMHTPYDNLSNVNFSYLVNTTKLITGTLAYLADTPRIPLQIRIVSPKKQAVYYNGMFLHQGKTKTMRTLICNDLWIWAEPQKKENISHVEFYYDDILITTDTTMPFKWHCNQRSFGPHRITIVAYNKQGQKSTDYLDVFFINPFLK